MRSKHLDHNRETTNPLERLRAKQIRFIHEYLVDRNATAAYQRAGYVANRSTARRAAHVLTTNPDIQSALKAAERELLERVKLRQYEAHAELRAAATSDITNYRVAEDGQLTLGENVSPLATKAIQSLHRRTTTRTTKDGEQITTQDVRLTLWNKLEAIKIAGNAAGWLTPEKGEEVAASTNNYFLTLIQLAQQHGLTSTEGAEGFQSVRPADEAIDMTPSTGHAHGQSGPAAEKPSTK